MRAVQRSRGRDQFATVAGVEGANPGLCTGAVGPSALHPGAWPPGRRIFYVVKTYRACADAAFLTRLLVAKKSEDDHPAPDGENIRGEIVLPPLQRGQPVVSVEGKCPTCRAFFSLFFVVHPFYAVRFCVVCLKGAVKPACAADCLGLIFFCCPLGEESVLIRWAPGLVLLALPRRRTQHGQTYGIPRSLPKIVAKKIVECWRCRCAVGTPRCVCV